MSEIKNEKSAMRKQMETLGEGVYLSWLKDCNGVNEMTEIIKILKEIQTNATIEEYFQNQEDLTYFMNNFSTQVITNILRQSVVYGPNGEEVALELLTQYLFLFIQFMENPNYMPIWNSIKDIFDYTKPYYILQGTKNPNTKKLISWDEYNINHLPKKNKAHIDIKPEEEIDVLVESKDKQSKLKTWVRGIVCETFDDYFTVRVFLPDPLPTTIRYNSFEYREKGSMTTDWEWRMNLQIGDMVDFYDRRQFYPGTIVKKIETCQKGLKHIIYRVSFRVYQDTVPDLTPYKKFWPMKEISKDDNGRIFLGDPENFDESVNMFSKYLFPPNTKIKSDFNKQLENYEESYYIDKEIRAVDDNGNKTITIGRPNNYSFYYNSLLNSFGRKNGFEKIIDLLSNKTNQLNDLFTIINYILKMSSSFLYQGVVIEIATRLKEGIFTSLSSMSNAELRNIKRDNIDLIIEVLSFYLGVLFGEEKRDEVIEEFSLSFAIKMIKTTYLDKRTNAVKTIIDLIRNSKNNPLKEKNILELIEKHHIFYEIYGPNSHVQLITKSKDLLEIMLQNDKLSDEEMEMIWGATKKGDLEGKLTILKILKELSPSLQPKHIKRLLESILSSNSSDLVDDEIDLIFELSLNQTDETITERCIQFFTQFLLESNMDEGERTTLLVNKIYIITRKNPTFKVNVINMALSTLEENKNTSLGMKILSAYISKPNIENDYDLDRLLIEDNKLVYLYIKSFKEYIEYVKAKITNLNIDIDTLPLNDKFTHSQNIKARITFLNTLVDANLWKVDIDPIDFIFKIIVESPICIKDEQQFYHWIKFLLIKSSFETEIKIFKLFTDKICSIPSIGDEDSNTTKQKKSINNLSIEAFDTFLKVFVDINIKNQKIIQKQDEDKSELKNIVIVKPEQLEGFDILWRIVFESYSDEIMNKGSEALHSLFSNVQTDDSSVNSSSEQLIRLCLEEIKSTKNPNINKKSLRMVRRIIEESEKYGTAGVISHNGLLKRNLITLKVISNIKAFFSKEKAFELKLYSNTTIFDLKKMISDRILYHCDFINYFLYWNEKDKCELMQKDNGKTLYMMGITNNNEIHIFANGLEKNIPTLDICVNHQPTTKAMKVFNQWFDRFSTNGKMTQEDCAKFVKAVTNCHDDVSASDSRVKELFNDRDKNKDNLIEREEFLEFYSESTVGKAKLVYENLRTMGVRNDLLQMYDPYYPENTQKELMPRYQLANNEEFFNVIFDMQTGDNELSKEAFEFIGMLATNPVIYNKILSESKNDWAVVFPDENPVKLIYSLQIIESFIEGLSGNLEDNQCEKWIQTFVKNKGYEYFVKLFQSKLTQITQPNSNPFNVLCFQYLIEIIKTFCIASIEILQTDSQISLESVYLSTLRSYLKKEELCSVIKESINTNELITVLMTVLDIYLKKKEVKDDTLINPIIELSSILIPISQQTLSNPQYWVNIFSYGILDQSETTRKIFVQSANRMCILLCKKSLFEFIEMLFDYCYDLIKSLNEEKAQLSEQLFDLFVILLGIFNKHNEEFKTTKFDILKFVQSLIDIVNQDINQNVNKISERLFIGYVYILSELAGKCEDIKAYISNNSNLMEEILTKVLFKQGSNELEDIYENEDFVDIDALNKLKSNYNGSEGVRFICYSFVLSMVKDSLYNFEKFFNINIMAKEEDNAETKKETSISNEMKNEGYVGLKNLGCICYMNSTIQHFFMVPTLRYTVLRFNDNEKENMEPQHNIDDSMFHQVQRMFSFLDLSKRVDYNPFGFTYSFKDFDGFPTKIHEQKDAQEFLGIFLDRLESQCKDTKYKYMLQSIFGGKNCSQILCSQCGKVSNRFEDSVFLSLEVKNMKTLNDSLDKLISEEQIDEYMCEGCNKKVSITKRNLLSTLPNILIIHLQRIFYNFEYDHNEKINSRLEFPRQINLKPYTIEEITRKNNSTNEPGQNDSEEMYFKSDAYYDYYLMGVIVHVGSADSGHYYSYINTIRDGNCCEARYNHKDPTMAASWLEFNDSYISKFDVEKLNDECFGGMIEDKEKSISMFNWNKGEKCKNAYMLVYERKIKSPMKIILDPSAIKNKDSVISYKEEDEKKIMKEYDILRYYNTPEYKTKVETIFSQVFCDVKRNEYFKFEPFYYTDRKMPKKYYLEINEDNSNFEKMQNISDVKFTMFFDMIISTFEQTVVKLTSEVKDEAAAMKRSLTFLNFIFNILSKKDKAEQLLIPAIEKFIHIVQYEPICLESIWNYIKSHFEVLKGFLLSDNKTIVKAYCKLVLELARLLIDSGKEEFKQTLKDASEHNLPIVMNKYQNCLLVIRNILLFFPKIPTKTLKNIRIIAEMIKDLFTYSNELLIYCGENNIMYIFITFLLGRESPCYEQTFSNNHDYWDHSLRCSLIDGGEVLVEVVYMLLSLSTLVNKEEGKYDLSEPDIQCLMSSNFIKYIIKNCDWLLCNFLVPLSKNNLRFTIISCIEILKYINEFEIINESKLYIKILKSIIPILNINDGFEQYRFEILLGIPQYEIEGGVPFPYVGYHLMKNPVTKIISSKSFLKRTYKLNIIQKLFEFKGDDDCAIESLLIILEACQNSQELLKYIACFPYENILYRDLFEYATYFINKYSDTKSESKNIEEAKQLAEMIDKLEGINKNSILINPSVIPGFKGFPNNYLIKDIKRVDIELVYSENNIHIFLCDYTANYIPLDNIIKTPINFSQSKRQLNSTFKSNLLKEVDENETTQIDVPGVLYIQAEKINYIQEKDFYLNLIQRFLGYKKITIETKYSVPNAKSVLKRIVALNTSNQFPIIEFKLCRPSVIENPNEHLPKSVLMSSFNISSVLDLYSLTKFNPEKEWTWEWESSGNNLSIEIKSDPNKYNSITNTNNGTIYMNYNQHAVYSENSMKVDEDIEYGPKPKP